MPTALVIKGQNLATYLHFSQRWSRGSPLSNNEEPGESLVMTRAMTKGDENVRQGKHLGQAGNVAGFSANDGHK